VFLSAHFIGAIYKKISVKRLIGKKFWNHRYQYVLLHMWFLGYFLKLNGLHMLIQY